eukprot:11853794-Prorocentrum_lima.AAC.1
MPVLEDQVAQADNRLVSEKWRTTSERAISQRDGIAQSVNKFKDQLSDTINLQQGLRSLGPCMWI